MPGHIPLPATAIELPLLPLRDVVVFPHMVIPLFVGRTKSIHALETAMEGNKAIMLVAQKSAAQEEPAVSDMHATGCIASILQLLKLPLPALALCQSGPVLLQRCELALDLL